MTATIQERREQYFEKAFFDESESFSFYEKMFNSAGCLTCYILRLLFLIEYKGVCKSCVTNRLSEYSDLFFFGFSKSRSSFSQSEFDQEEFIVDIVISALLLFCMKESLNFSF